MLIISLLFQKEQERQKKKEYMEELQQRENERRIHSYEDVFTEENLRANMDQGNDSDDFM